MKKKKFLNYQTGERIFLYLLLLPLITIISIILIFPLGYSFFLSLFSWDLFSMGKEKIFIFLLHYRNALVDRYFLKSIQNTLLFLGGAVSIELGLGFAIALLLLGKLPCQKVINSIILIPMIMAHTIVALIWKFVYDSSFGIFRLFLRTIGLDKEIGWLTDKSIALLSVIIVEIWQSTPFVILVLFAGLCIVPINPIEAAKIDGASYSQIVRYIFLPFLKPLILFVLLLRTIDAYKIFDLIYVLTRGGPGMTTESISMYAYKTGFIKCNMGYAMALSVIIFVIVLAVSLLYIFFLGKQKS